MSDSPTIKLLHEAESHVIEVHLLSGDCYKGKLTMVEDNMNIWLSDVTHYTPDNVITQSDSVFIRGSQILFTSLPEMLVNAPIFRSPEVTQQVPRSSKLKQAYMQSRP